MTDKTVVHKEFGSVLVLDEFSFFTSSQCPEMPNIPSHFSNSLRVEAAVKTALAVKALLIK